MADFITITIDGAAATGTSSLAAELGARFGWPALNTGHLYRGIALVAGWQSADIHDAKAMGRIARDIEYEFDGGSVVAINGRAVTERELRETSGVVAHISHYRGVRRPVRGWQHHFARDKHIVVEGRDLGSVVFPGAPVKIYLTCDNVVRAQRRSNASGRVVSVEELLERDRLDTEREESPMVQPEGALPIDTTVMSIPEVANFVVQYIRVYKPDVMRVIEAA